MTSIVFTEVVVALTSNFIPVKIISTIPSIRGNSNDNIIHRRFKKKNSTWQESRSPSNCWGFQDWELLYELPVFPRATLTCIYLRLHI